jgi:hypothetical protein
LVVEHLASESTDYREPLEPIAHLDSAYATDAMKPYGTSYATESRQNKFDLDVDPHSGTGIREYKHSTVANVYAVAGVIVALAIGPAEQKWQSYVKPPPVSSFDRLVHIRTQIPLD